MKTVDQTIEAIYRDIPNDVLQKILNDKQLEAIFRKYLYIAHHAGYEARNSAIHANCDLCEDCLDQLFPNVAIENYK